MKKLLTSLAVLTLAANTFTLPFQANADTPPLSPTMSWTWTVTDNSTKTVNFSTTNNSTLNVDCGGGTLSNGTSAFTCTYATGGNYTVSITNPETLTSISGLTRAGIISFRGGNASNLQGSLSLSYNQISQVAVGAFAKMTKLSGLEMDNNQITSIDDGDFWGMSQLSELNVSRNQVSNISANAFKGLTTLGNLHLESNLLRNLDVNTFQGLTNLTYLGLDRNNLVSLPADIFNSQTSGSFSVSLWGNCMDVSVTFTNTKIDNSRKSNQSVCAAIVYSPTTLTSGDVIGTVILTGGTADKRSQIDISNLVHTRTGNGNWTFNLSSVP
ncbi:MAG: leucine-rich repeat domain-containing protein [Candidatus Peribacteria bacterium]|jgi:hypothetical protein|nr:leucine-rich repeat domain-containing protein [Candidatus Peribacteria bacterium]